MGAILLLEDNDSMRMHTENSLATDEYLKKRGFTVEPFRRIDQAKKYFKEHKDEIGCIITDLNMSDEWLGEFIPESNGCLLSGWVWLNRFVFTERPDMPTVIYSGFIDELKAYIPPEQRLLLGNKNIVCVDKGSNEVLSGLIKAIEQVTQAKQSSEDNTK